jgi:2'-5' RNA ligase
VEAALGEIGFRIERRRFRPHLTIGRVRQGPDGMDELAELIRQNADFDGGMSTVYETAVLTSELTREGPVYELLAHAQLGGKDTDDEDDVDADDEDGESEE